MKSMTDYFRALEGSRIRALLDRNMELLWRLHAEEYQLVTPSGRTFGRERYLREIESGNLQYWRWEAGPIEVRATDRMAIVRYQATLELGSAGYQPPGPRRLPVQRGSLRQCAIRPSRLRGPPPP